MIFPSSWPLCTPQSGVRQWSLNELSSTTSCSCESFRKEFPNKGWRMRSSKPFIITFVTSRRNLRLCPYCLSWTRKSARRRRKPCLGTYSDVRVKVSRDWTGKCSPQRLTWTISWPPGLGGPCIAFFFWEGGGSGNPLGEEFRDIGDSGQLPGHEEECPVDEGGQWLGREMYLSSWPTPSWSSPRTRSSNITSWKWWTSIGKSSIPPPKQHLVSNMTSFW